ncbi:class I SAM-dependent methyltransferase [Shewanella benthica]|uniref:hypothetical protein n=1 Tax=Shewanella benthica TaxID=43661 RepID=UPI001879B5FD|nr:hypothetical protein [Shewanella benthica]MBE7214198.1 hypothetical protein [Shewanella benthica]MCL1065158.1 class I SAM-dependent methyltransferase [Shewanella benthica]
MFSSKAGDLFIQSLATVFEEVVLSISHMQENTNMGVLQKLSELNLIIKYRKQLKPVLTSYLHFFENTETSVWGSITEDDELGIKHAVVQSGKYKGPIVEIGALFGHTTNLLASMKRTGVILITVENFTWNPFSLPPEVHRQFTMRTLRYALEHCSTQVFDGNAADFYLANATLKPSLIFIDAGHDYESVRKDIDWAVSTGCPVISGHDYTDAHPGVVKAVDETFGDNISLYGSVWIHQRRECE